MKPAAKTATFVNNRADAQPRRIALVLAAALLTLAGMEAIAFLSFTFLLTAREFRYRDLDAFGTPPPTRAEMETWRRWGYDRELGWLRRPDTREAVSGPDGDWTLTIDARGARRETFDGPSGVVSAYGDSFTFGHEVEDDETWPHYLSELTGTRVDNWGQTGWGTDQALLRLARNLPQHRTELVVLAVQAENIQRLLNCYRPFLVNNADVRFGFKPMLVVTGDGTLAWMPNPLERADTPEDFTAAFARARAVDTWYLENRQRVRPRFPYLLRLPAALLYAARHRERPNLYERPDAVARMDFVLKAFHELAEQHGFVPVVLFIPEPRDIRRVATGRDYGYRQYVARLRARPDVSRLIVVDVLEHPFDFARFNREPFKDHASPYGNRVIARIVHDAIAERIPSRRPTP